MRHTAVKLLNKALNEGGFSNYLLDAFFRSNPEVSGQDRGFLQAVFLGTLRNVFLLDGLLSRLCSAPYGKIPEKIKNILRTGAFQIMFMDRIPPHAAVSESVNLAKKMGHRGTAALVNALLRRMSRERDSLLQSTEITEDSTPSDIAELTSHPLWLVERYIASLGRNDAVEILRANNSLPPRNFRVMEPAKLEAHPVYPHVEKNRFAKTGVEIADAPLSAIQELMRGGAVSPQDESSLIAVSLLEKAEGPLLELCCGRGNKSAAIAAATGGIFSVNVDISLNKLKELAKGGHGTLHPVLADVSTPLPFKSSFPFIFLDAPCTGLGTVRRHPEIKYRRTAEDISTLPAWQKGALANAATYLAKGGRILYSVCSTEPDEGPMVVESFLRSTPGFSLVDMGKERPDLKEAGLVHGGSLRILPGQHNMDGFFAALIEKES